MSESSCRNECQGWLWPGRRGSSGTGETGNVFELCLGGNNIEGLVTGKSRRSQRCSSNFHLCHKEDGVCFTETEAKAWEQILMKSTILAFVLLGVWVIFRIDQVKISNTECINLEVKKSYLHIKANEQGSSIKVWPWRSCGRKPPGTRRKPHMGTWGETTVPESPASSTDLLSGSVPCAA